MPAISREFLSLVGHKVVVERKIQEESFAGANEECPNAVLERAKQTLYYGPLRGNVVAEEQSCQHCTKYWRSQASCCANTKRRTKPWLLPCAAVGCLRQCTAKSKNQSLSAVPPKDHDSGKAC
jgi:hypothetical protein